MREQPRRFALAVTGATFYAIAAVAATVVLGRVTEQVILPAFSTGVSRSTVVDGAVALLAVGLVKAGSIVLRRFNGGITTFRVQAAWRRRVTDLYLDVPMTFHRSRPTGELLAHTDSDVLAATEVMNPVPFTVGVVVLIVFALVSLALVDLWMMALALLLFPALALVNRLYTQRIERPVEQVQEEVGQVSRIVHESIDGALVVKTLGRRDQEVDRLSTAAEQLRATRVRVGRMRGTFEPVLQGLPTLGAITLLAFGSWEISTGRINTGELVQGISLFSILAFPVQVVGYFLQELPRSVVSTARLDRLMTAPTAPTPTEAQLARRGRSPSRSTTSPSRTPRGHRCSTDVLVPASIPARSVALVGATGAGKSTLCELLVRLADPDHGTVRVGGVDLRRADPDSLHQHVSLVFQETFLFADTLWENITLGLGARNDEVRAALAVARAEQFVAELPMGVATVVGERGVTLSGGQRQRVALARALVRRPRVLVLDDATSAVDPVVESEILGGLRHELAVTTLVVARPRVHHRARRPGGVPRRRPGGGRGPARPSCWPRCRRMSASCSAYETAGES